MKIILKFFLNYILRVFNLEIVSKDRQKINYSFDFDYQKKFNPFDKLMILDIGANRGQSINRFKSIFKNSEIHSFEPDPKAFSVMKKKFGRLKQVYLNQKALGLTNEIKNLNIYQQSTDNSFNKKKNEVPIDEISVETITIDSYLSIKKIEEVNILKIDTQSFNKQILQGSILSLEKKIFDVIEIELNLGDYYEYSNSFLEIEKFLDNYKLAGINKSGSILDNKKFYVDVYYVKKVPNIF